MNEDVHTDPVVMTPAELKSARKELGMTQQKLADWTGHYIRTIQRWEAGDSPIKAPMANLVRNWLAQRQRQAARFRV